MEKVLKHFVIKNKTVGGDIAHMYVILYECNSEKILYLEKHMLSSEEPEFDQQVLKVFRDKKVLANRFAIRISTLTTIYNELKK